MSKDSITSFTELFGEPTALTPEKFQSFMTETMDHLLKLREQLTSSDPKERESALSEAVELQAMLNHHMIKLGEFTNPYELSEAEMMDRMSESDQELLVSAKDQFTKLKTSFSPA